MGSFGDGFVDRCHVVKVPWACEVEQWQDSSKDLSRSLGSLGISLRQDLRLCVTGFCIGDNDP